jgi:tetratricopeptide (TPR) repeat protein
LSPKIIEKGEEMKKALFLLPVVSLLIGCGGNAVSSNNANVAAVNTAAAPVAETNQAANVQPQPEVVPAFTNADEALAAGKKYLDENKTEAAIEALQQATKLNADLAEAHFQLGIAYALKESEDEALQKVDDAPTPAKTPKASNKKIKEGQAVILTDSDKAFQNAAKAYEKITKKDPKNADAFFNLGRAYNKIQMDRESEKALRQAVKLNAEDSEYQTELGAILIKLAQYDEAVKVLKKAQELDENNLRAADLLEKAQAGQKRTNFGIKPKIPADLLKQQQEQSRGRTSKPKEDTTETAPEVKTPPAPAPTKP